MAENKQVTIEIMEPKGVLVDPKREGLSNPRLTTLNGKTLGLLSIHVDNLHQFASELFFDILQDKLLERYPDVKFFRAKSFGSPGAVVNDKELAAQCDAWVEGVKDAITQGQRDVGVYMERAGKPGVNVCTTELIPSKAALQDINGMPNVRIASVPATTFCAAKRDPKLMEKVVEDFVPELLEKLLTPLTEEEKKSFNRDYDYSNKKFTGATYSEAYEKLLEYCEENHLTDGQPIVPPTPEAVDWMLTGTSYPRDKVIATMFPKRGIATVEKIAICAVMAGMKPEWLPVLLAIIEEINPGDFNQFHIVNEILPTIFISGPMIKELGLNNKCGYLAPGHRINSTIGRAVLLCMTAIGWRDMTIYSSPGGPGRPAAYGNYFIPENQDDSPWGSWAEQQGFGPDDTIITICEHTSQSGGPVECMSNADYEERLGQVTNMFCRTAPIFKTFGMPENSENVRHMLVLHPSLARQIANHGMTKAQFVDYLYEKNVIDYDTMTPEQREDLIEQLTKEKMVANKQMHTMTPEEVKPGLHREPFKPENCMVFVAGSGAGNTMIFQTCWASTGKVEDVAVPKPWKNTVIHGATLTKYGK